MRDRGRTRAASVGTLISLAVVTACNGTSSYLDASGTAGRAEGTLGWWLTGVACAVVLLVCLAILASMARHRGEHNVPASYAELMPNARAEATPSAGSSDVMHRGNIRSGLRWIYVGLSLTMVVLLVTFAGTMRTLNATSRPPSTPALTLAVVAHQWWWEIRYRDPAHPEWDFTTANEVHLPVGQPVHVELRSADVIHSFWIPQLAGKTDVIPGQVNEMWLEAERPGTSRGMCAEYCGLQHAMMALAVTEESPTRFAAWAAARRAIAVAPATPMTQTGQAVFTRSCGACHSVEGTNSLGRVGPDLTHVASRADIGAGALENTPTNMARWITNAPSIKVGARMPAIPLGAAELHAVVAYLQTLQ